MKKLIAYLVVVTVSMVIQGMHMLDLPVDGAPVVEVVAGLVAVLCTLVSIVLVLLYLQAEIKKDMTEIADIKRQIDENEAEQRRLLREMGALRPHLMRPDIRKKLPKRK